MELKTIPMKILINAVSALALLGLTQTRQASVVNCVFGSTDKTVTSFGYEPDPLLQNQQVCHNAVGTLSAPVVDSAKLALVGRYMG